MLEAALGQEGGERASLTAEPHDHIAISGPPGGSVDLERRVASSRPSGVSKEFLRVCRLDLPAGRKHVSHRLARNAPPHTLCSAGSCVLPKRRYKSASLAGASAGGDVGTYGVGPAPCADVGASGAGAGSGAAGAGSGAAV